ncbi:hypothetical protein [Lacipirellula parvula]|uniref:Acyl-CoA dehydrogenase n=1 Tax=Lacipirellula parvula TaxID=2650471 RepID=A0A5K7XE50_9BACT|nr:hypothetical protein [Lacipirellula parvula]BBO35060.1 acyl-CoA dehydrogenase [Lacipirellula parvula]
MERLENRQMMAGDVAVAIAGASFYDDFLQNDDHVVNAVTEYGPQTPPGFLVEVPTAHFPDVIGDWPTENQQLTEAELDADMGLPMLDSLPGAPKTLYLDFTGHFQASWRNGRGEYANITTPAYDGDYDPAHFDAEEQQFIRDVWAAVAEDYAPFNINVTTHYYGDFNDGHALRVAIGGASTDWYVNFADTERPTGTSDLDSFNESDKSNVVYVFEEEYSNLFTERIKVATTISHEAGHAFGLRHHVVFDANGEVISEYHPGTAIWTPIMGDNNSTDRTTWNLGMAEDGLQDDMAFLSWKLGNRTDDHGGDWSAATPLSMPLTYNGTMTGQGIIEQTSDADGFRFTTSGGSINVAVHGLEWFNNLAPKVELWSSQGLVASANVTNNGFRWDHASLHAEVAPGDYMVVVKSMGDYGNVGNYTVSVSPELVLTAGNRTAVAPVIAPVVSPASPPKFSLDAYYAQLGNSDDGGQRRAANTGNLPVTPASPSGGDRPVLKRAVGATTSVASESASLFDAAFELLGAA